MNIQRIRAIAKLWPAVALVLVAFPWAMAAEDTTTLDKQLVAAAKHGNPADLKKLLAQGAKVNATDYTGKTALIWALPATGLLNSCLQSSGLTAILCGISHQHVADLERQTECYGDTIA